MKYIIPIAIASLVTTIFNMTLLFFTPNMILLIPDMGSYLGFLISADLAIVALIVGVLRILMDTFYQPNPNLERKDYEH